MEADKFKSDILEILVKLFASCKTDAETVSALQDCLSVMAEVTGYSQSSILISVLYQILLRREKEIRCSERASLVFNSLKEIFEAASIGDSVKEEIGWNRASLILRELDF